MRQTDQTAAELLGYSGLLPFIALAAMVAGELKLPGFDELSALAAYGALILSFLGGISWGLAVGAASPSPLERRTLFVASVIPSLIAWLAVLLPFELGIWILVAAFVLVYLHDRRVAAEGIYAAWFARLRLVLTSVAVACMVLAGLTA